MEREEDTAQDNKGEEEKIAETGKKQKCEVKAKR